MKIWRGKRNRKETKENSHTHTHRYSSRNRKSEKWEFETEKKLKSEILFFCWICSTLFDSTVQLKSAVSFKNIVTVHLGSPDPVLLLKFAELFGIFCWIYYCCNCWNLLLLPSFSGTYLLNSMLKRDSIWQINKVWIIILSSIHLSSLVQNFSFGFMLVNQ